MDLEKYAPDTARKIAEKIVDDALAQGLAISVWDGEAWARKRCTDRESVLQGLASTEADTLHFRRANGERVGWVTLIWSNDGDVISDNSDNPATEALLAPAMALAEAMPEEAVSDYATPSASLARLWLELAAKAAALDAKMNRDGRERPPTGDDYNDLYNLLCDYNSRAVEFINP